MVDRTRHCQIIGAISAGKTSLVALLGQAGIHTVFENFNANPFLEAFYSDPVANAFETELTFLLQHYHALKIASANNSTFAADFSIYLDLAYANVTLSDTDKELFSAVLGACQRKLGDSSVLVHLECDPLVLLSRIRARARAVEVAITYEYLQALDRAIHEVVQNVDKSIKVITINTETIDYLGNIEHRDNTISTIVQALTK